MKAKERRAKAAKVIRCLVSSFDSHLDSAVDTEKRCGWCGGRGFHWKCLDEYWESVRELIDIMK